VSAGWWWRLKTRRFSTMRFCHIWFWWWSPEDRPVARKTESRHHVVKVSEERHFITSAVKRRRTDGRLGLIFYSNSTAGGLPDGQPDGFRWDGGRLHQMTAASDGRRTTSTQQAVSQSVSQLHCCCCEYWASYWCRLVAVDDWHWSHTHCHSAVSCATGKSAYYSVLFIAARSSV